MPDLSSRIARLRVPLGFFFAVLVLWLARPTASSLVWGVLVSAVGEALRVWAAGHLQKSREVTSSGPYRWFAHPLYVGSSIMGVGLAIASRHIVVTLLIAIYLGTTVTAAIRNEEAFLRRTFGDRYDRYRHGGSTAGDSGVPRRFTLTQAFANREHRAVAGLAVAVLLLILKATYNDVFWRTAGTR